MVDDVPRVLANRYEVGELIGRGGMAEVHIGHDTRLGRTVAIKILRSDLARDPSFQARFRREAQAAASLNHPAIVAVYDTGEDLTSDQNGTVSHVPFIVMEYVEGHTVRDILRDGHAVPIEEAVEIAAGVLSALEYSHHAGIVHRDIKPANVMLTPTGAVKVMDFGIARALADSAATMTQTQAVIGTAQYLSPEQARGETVDARSDLYSTGCLLFELLTGRPPFTGDSPVAVAYQHVREPAPTPSSFASDVPDALDRITLKALAKDRDSRYSTAAEFRSDLEASVRGGHVAAPAVGVLAAAVPMAAESPTQILTQPPTMATQVMPGGAPMWAPTAPGTGAMPTVAPEEPRRKQWLLWTLIAIAVLAVGGIVLLAMMNSNSTPKTVAVPTLVNKTKADAQTALAAANLTMKPVLAASTSVPKDTVISSDPTAGTQVALKSEVTVTISTGPATTTVPDVSGLTQDQARSQLTAAGLTVATVETDDSPLQPKDRVTKTDPAANAPAAAGSAVTLYVSSGQVNLPDLKGMAEADAKNALTALKLIPSISTVESATAPAGSVVSQDRTPGLVPQGTTISIQIATAPTTAVVPDVVGKTQADATNAILAVGLKVTIVQTTPANPTKVPGGEVVSTDPVANTTVPLGSTVTVTVSSNPTSTTPPGG
ncbi:MAG: Stk1 family PASTA domain-containing Ser/Thr kinase [Cellulomonas sp.]